MVHIFSRQRDTTNARGSSPQSFVSRCIITQQHQFSEFIIPKHICMYIIKTTWVRIVCEFTHKSQTPASGWAVRRRRCTSRRRIEIIKFSLSHTTEVARSGNLCTLCCLSSNSTQCIRPKATHISHIIIIINTQISRVALL